MISALVAPPEQGQLDGVGWPYSERQDANFRQRPPRTLEITESRQGKKRVVLRRALADILRPATQVANPV